MKKTNRRFSHLVLSITLAVLLAVLSVSATSCNETSNPSDTSNVSEDLAPAYSFITGKTLRLSDGAAVDNKPDYMITDFIPCFALAYFFTVRCFVAYL